MQGKVQIRYRKSHPGDISKSGDTEVSEEVVVLNMTPNDECHDKAKKSIFEAVEIECTRPRGKRETVHLKNGHNVTGMR